MNQKIIKAERDKKVTFLGVVNWEVWGFFLGVSRTFFSWEEDGLDLITNWIIRLEKRLEEKNKGKANFCTNIIDFEVESIHEIEVHFFSLTDSTKPKFFLQDY